MFSFIIKISCLGIITAHLVRSKKMTLTNARKLSNSITSFVPAVMYDITYVIVMDSRQMLGIITVLIFLASSGKKFRIYYLIRNDIFFDCLGLGYGSGYIVNFADIVPAYSGVIFGIANTLASLAGLIGNIVAGIM